MAYQNHHIGMHQGMHGLRHTEKYVWNVEYDFLGNGATSIVYKCRKKQDGRHYAAKVMNKRSQGRRNDIMEREIHILQQLKHPNIVQFIDLEYTTSQNGERNAVIVMELCGESLHTKLTHPDNAFGLEEETFKSAVYDISLGMEYLRNQKIIHRDLKPGNILCVPNIENGSTTYKISDFGAARFLEDGGEFTSIFGTEEYLHPDIYEKAIMNRPKMAFNDQVDLWSLGVTFYHLATGNLPFCPFKGRNDKITMDEMITKKKPGVISCHQLKDNGPLEYSNELPMECRMSKSLKNLITPVLSRLLETDAKRVIPYDEFFKEIKRIVNNKVLHVYVSRTSTIDKIYMQPDKTLSHLQDTLALVTGIKESDQELFHNFSEFKPDFNMKIHNYPTFTLDNPLFLFSKDHLKSQQMEQNKLLIGNGIYTIHLPPGAQILKKSCKLQRKSEKLAHECKAILNARSCLKMATQKVFESITCNCEHIEDKIKIKYQSLENYKKVLSRISKSADELDKIKKAEALYQQGLAALATLKDKIKNILKSDTLDATFLKATEEVSDLPSPLELTSCVKIIYDLGMRISREKSRSNYNELSRKFDTERLSQIHTTMDIKVDHFQSTKNTLHDSLVDWLGQIWGHRDGLIEEFGDLSATITKFDDIYTNVNEEFADTVENMVNGLMKDQMPDDEMVQMSNELTKMLDSLDMNLAIGKNGGVGAASGGGESPAI
eukprot:TCONS_00026766-protein